VSQDFSGLKEGLQGAVSPPKVVDPDGSVDKNHATRLGRRRRIGLRPRSVPPSFDSRRALSRAINASRPMRTSAVFLETPVNRAARLMSDTSIFKVVRMYVF
jgi:hypothetical protein